MKKQIHVVVLLSMALLLTACTSPDQKTTTSETATETETAVYQKIDAEKAKEMIDAGGVAILDVRTQEEYDAGHIPDTLLLPVDEINETTAAELLPDKDAVILVYCRSGNRSKTATDMLLELGYTAVYDFGGINDWPYDVAK